MRAGDAHELVKRSSQQSSSSSSVMRATGLPARWHELSESWLLLNETHATKDLQSYGGKGHLQNWCQ